MRYLNLLLILLFMCSCGASKAQQTTTTNSEDTNVNYGEYIKRTGKPQKFEQDLVPDEKTAIKIADVIWDARYKPLKGIRDLPYTVTLEDNKVWYVKTNLPDGYFGTVLHIKISKYDGKILYIWSEG